MLLMTTLVLSALFVRPAMVQAAGGAVCVLLDQGERACPDATESTDTKTAFPAAAGSCYYYDPGNPNAGTVKGFPGWQKSDCNADIFKEGLCVPGKAAQNPKCQRIGEAPDSALSCPTAPGSSCDLTTKYIDPLINVLAALVGVVVTASIIYGGVQYASSADDPSKVSQAKSRITNSLIALVSFFFLYAFIQWLIPGGFI